MSVIKKIIIMTGIFFGVVILASLISDILGYRGLLVTGYINMPYILQQLIEFILCSVHVVLIMGYTFNLYDKRLFKMAIPISIANFVLGFTPIVEATTIIFTLGIIVYGIKTKALKNLLKRYLQISIPIILYQLIIIPIKMGDFIWGYNDVPINQFLIFSIDNILFVLFLYLRGVEDYVQVVRQNNGKILGSNRLILLFDKFRQDNEQNAENSLVKEAILNLSAFKKAKLCVLFLLFNFTQFFLILFVCNLDNLLLHGFAIVLPYLGYSIFCIKKRYHSKSELGCTLIAISSFYVLAKCIPPIHYTQMLPICVALLYAYALWRIFVYTEEHEKAIDKLELYSKIEGLEHLIYNMKEGM